MCEVINAEGGLVGELGNYVDSACPQGNNSDSCNSLRTRHGNLQNVHRRAHEENDSLEESDFQEMIEGAYKGKNKNDNGAKTCRKFPVDIDIRNEILFEDLEIGIVSPEGYYDFFKATDGTKANDDKCNNWKLVWMEPDSANPGSFVKAKGPPVKINEDQEGLCVTECTGKQAEVAAKGDRFKEELDEAIGQIEEASVQMATYAPLFAEKTMLFTEQQNGDEPLCPPRGGTLLENPIHVSVVLTSYVAAKALEISAEICKHPANQDVLGNNGAAACTPLEISYRIAKEVYDMMDFLNSDFQGAQIDFIENCVEKMGDTIAEIKEIVQRIEILVVTPQGKRETEVLDWPNKDPVQ
ncbi:hypothetical protein [Desulforhopalus singaporensis]|nr:hypothetical protein [Desulforhopalus singaporensis]